MSLNPLDRILEILEARPEWQSQRRYRQVLQSWETAIEPKIAQQTRLLYIARNVLWVATANAVWAQTLSLQRYSLLKKLNAHLEKPLGDIRFSPAQWHNSKPLASNTSSPEKHPSAIEIEEPPLVDRSSSASKTPKEAFKRWAALIESRSQNLPLCPCCQSPTPEGELQRWEMCAHCIAKEWASDRQNNF
jgi:predicted nucleic acid-binding Zn ribbon protein